MLITRPDYPPIKKHQTAVFVYCPKTESDNYWERLQRLVWSFNHDQTIKADVFLVRGQGIIPLGSKSQSVKARATFIPVHKTIEAKPAVKEYETWAHDLGYQIILIAANPSQKLVGSAGETPVAETPVAKKLAKKKHVIPPVPTASYIKTIPEEDLAKMISDNPLTDAIAKISPGINELYGEFTKNELGKIKPPSASAHSKYISMLKAKELDETF